MKKYFIHVNGSNIGPYSFEDLRSMKIQKTTPVWYDGLGNWKNAGDVPELRALFTSNAATFQTSQNYSNPASRSTYNFTDDNLSGNIGAKRSGGTIAAIIIGVVLVLLVGGGFFAYSMYQKQKRERMDELMYELQDYQTEQDVIENEVQEMIDSMNRSIATVEDNTDYGTSTYSGRFNNYNGGILKVTGSDDQDLMVYLAYDDGNGCKGNISGKGSVIGEDKVQLKTSSGCKLTIKYKNRVVSVEESTDCSSEHPGGCTFDGIYSKEK